MAGHVAGAWILRNRVPESLSARPEKRSRRRRPAPPPAVTPVESIETIEAPGSAGTPVRQPSPVSLIPAPRRPWASAVLVGVGAGLWHRLRRRG